MIEQRSAEWFKQRTHKVTGSNIGAAIGVNPWKTQDDLIRSMVREYHGAESEFQGNIATQHGQLHEPLAQMDYQNKTGNFVEECGFFVHPEFAWLGASPDGLIGDDGVLEVKCPFSQRDKNPPEFKTLAEQPHYKSQVMVELACTGRSFCHFYQWTPNGESLEVVNYDDAWWSEYFPVLEAFYARYLSELDNPEHLEEKFKEINTLGAMSMIEEYDELSATIDDATARKKEILDSLITMAKDRNAIIHGRKLTKVDRKGSVDYRSIPQLKGLDLEQFRKKPTQYWRFS